MIGSRMVSCPPNMAPAKLVQYLKGRKTFSLSHVASLFRICGEHRLIRAVALTLGTLGVEPGNSIAAAAAPGRVRSDHADRSR
jgi:hypothetical protein